MVGDLSKSSPLGLDCSTFEPNDIHLGEIFETFGLVCEACYVYHPHSGMWLLPMRRILGLMFDVTMPFLYYSVGALDHKFDSAFRRRRPDLIAPGMRAIFTVLSMVGCECLPTQ